MISRRTTWLARLRRISAFLWTLAAGAVLCMAVMRAQVINGLRAAGAANAAGWYDRADFLIPYYLVFGGAFLGLAVLTALLCAAHRRWPSGPTRARSCASHSARARSRPGSSRSLDPCGREPARNQWARPGVW